MKNILKRFLIGTFVALALMVASSALAAYDFGSATLKVGGRGQYVMTLQTLVGATPVDGSFGPITKAKVVEWQKAHGLIADGLFGPASKAKANETGTNFSTGCTNALGFSITTGLACSNLNANTFSAGCTNASGFSTTTGLACSSSSAHTFPTGCTNASGFSTTTGYSCLTGLLAVRGGGSSGHHATALSDDATLSSTSTIKGFTPLNVGNLGEPKTVIADIDVEGSVIISTTQAADTTNLTDYITLFIPTNTLATTTKVVKYADGASTTGFASDTAYANQAITSQDFFIVEVTAQDSTVLYYKIIVGIENDASLISVVLPIAAGAQVGTAESPKIATITVPNDISVLGRLDIQPVAFAHSFNLYSNNGFSTEIIGSNTMALAVGDTHAYIKVTAYDDLTTLYYDVTITREASDDATLDIATSTIKGEAIDSLGTPNAVLASIATAGATIISTTQAADTSNAGSFITLFDKTNDEATATKFVKYATGAPTTNFATDPAYNNEAITDQDFFIVKLTAGNSDVLYYKIVVTVLIPTADVTFALTTPEAGGGNAIVVVQTAGAKTIDVAVENTTASVVITGTMLGAQTDVVGGADSGDVVVTGTSTTPIYTVDTSDVSDGGEKTFTITVSQTNKTNIVYTVTVTVAEPISDDATLKAASTIKGETIDSLGTPNIVLGSAVAGAVTISSTQAADTTNLTSYITLFDKNNANATVKVVKYATDASTTNFATDPTYNNEAITDQDFFIVKLTAEDGTTVLYYKIVVTVAAPVIATASTIAKGASAPSVVVTGTDFDATIAVGDLTVGVGTTGLTFDAVTYEGPTEITVSFTGTSAGGDITIQAKTTAFDPVAQAASNTLTVSVPRYAIGDIGPAGGFIFYIDPIGAKLLPAGIAYLESVPNNQTASSIDWTGNAFDELSSGATATAVGTGQANTTAIAAQSDISAGGLCSNLDKGGKTDWFLPSKDELGLMYTNLKLGGFGGFGDINYWSSSESSATEAFNQDFLTGTQDNPIKDSTGGKVRCARFVSEADQSQITLYSTPAGFNHTSGSASIQVDGLVDSAGLDAFEAFKADDGLTDFTLSMTDGPFDGNPGSIVAVTKTATSQLLTITNVTQAAVAGPYILTITRNDGQTWAILVLVAD